MTKINEIYVCSICGNVVKVIQTGVGTLVCCGMPMKMVKKVPLKLTKKIA
jgi:superoxide reductase